MSLLHSENLSDQGYQCVSLSPDLPHVKQMQWRKSLYNLKNISLLNVEEHKYKEVEKPEIL